MSILIKVVRISAFRGLKNIEVHLEKTTVLTGMNNTGKTSFLKAMQLALGRSQFISQDDFFIKDNNCNNKITIDLLIIPVDKEGNQSENFSEDWEILLTTDRIKNDGTNSFVPLRTVITYDPINNNYKTDQSILKNWPIFEDNGKYWFEFNNATKKSFRFDQIPFFYMDAQRDILEDTRSRKSYLGKMLSKIEYSKEDIEAIEEQIELLNNKAVDGSYILSNIKLVLKELDSTMGNHSNGIEITPFTKKIRDLSKGLTIYYGDRQDSFSLEYHGMGTRSWSSLLTLKAFISLLSSNADKEKSIFFPILAIEEPESHLHPNAQKKLYNQINSIIGQKIISTHSPYIAATSELKQIRSFYKNEAVNCGKVDVDELTEEEIRKINRQVINCRGEILFSKLIVFFEGETEEQALPIFSEKYFGNKPLEMGLDFVGVGGKGNYLPFLRFAESLNIPWLIFSDGEEDTVKLVKDKVQELSKISKGDEEKYLDLIIFLDDGNNFEKQLISDGFEDEIKKAIIAQKEFSCEKHKNAYVEKINKHSSDCLLKTMDSNKTQLAPEIAEQIIKRERTPLPPKVLDLFTKVKSIIQIEDLKS